MCSPCAFAGGSSSRAGQFAKKKARRGKRPTDNEEVHEVVVPSKTTRREKSVASKQRASLPMNKWKLPDWERFRFQDPYNHLLLAGIILSSAMKCK